MASTIITIVAGLGAIIVFVSTIKIARQNHIPKEIEDCLLAIGLMFLVICLFLLALILK